MIETITDCAPSMGAVTTRSPLDSVCFVNADIEPILPAPAKPDSPLGELAEEVIVATPEIEQSWCHTASYTCAVAALDALHGNDVSWLPSAVAAAEGYAPSAHERFLIAGAGRDWPTAQEAA